MADVPDPQARIRYVQPNGTLTTEGVLLLLALTREVNALRARVAALEAP